MPSSRETVVNRALSGTELKAIIAADFQRLLDGEGLLSPHIAFGRVSYHLTMAIHVDNPMVPRATIEISSKGIAENIIDKNPDLAAIEAPPLTDPSPVSESGQLDLTRAITSPNAERLREGMPIPVLTRGHDGTTQMENITYPPGSFPELGPGEMMIRDASEMARARWGLVEPATQPEVNPEEDKGKLIGVPVWPPPDDEEEHEEYE